MTPEERSRTIDFILEHQAQLTVRMDQLTVRMDQLTVRMDQLAVVSRTSVETDMKLTEILQIQSHRLDRSERRLKQSEDVSQAILARMDRILDHLINRN